jgi:hypothetical protein
LIEVLLLNRHLAHEHVAAGLATALRAGAVTADAVALEARKAAQTEGEPITCSTYAPTALAPPTSSCRQPSSPSPTTPALRSDGAVGERTHASDDRPGPVVSAAKRASHAPVRAAGRRLTSARAERTRLRTTSDTYRPAPRRRERQALECLRQEAEGPRPCRCPHRRQNPDVCRESRCR